MRVERVSKILWENRYHVTNFRENHVVCSKFQSNPLIYHIEIESHAIYHKQFKATKASFGSFTMLITRSLQLFNPFSSDCSLIYFCTYDGACLLESSDHQYRCSKRVARLCSTVPPALKHDMIGVSYTIKLVSYSFKRLAHASFNLKLGLKGFKK